MSSRAGNLFKIRERIETTAQRTGRLSDNVQLLVVSKTWPAEIVGEVAEAGQLLFGENRLQEGEEKIPSLGSELEWHFIGTLQRNKVRKVLPLFSVIHSVSGIKLARFIDRVAGELGLKPRIYLEINLAGEESKHGFSVDELREFAQEVIEMKNVMLEGLMCIPPKVETPEEARPWFIKLRELRDEVQQLTGATLPGLSMGMSGDFEVAIEEGSTVVRVGSAIFGERTPWKREV